MTQDITLFTLIKLKDIDIKKEWRRQVALGNTLTGWKDWWKGLSKKKKIEVFSARYQNHWLEVDFNYWLRPKRKY